MSGKQELMYVILFCWAVLMYNLAVGSVQRNWGPGGVIAVLAASPVLIFALAVTVEGRRPLPLLNLKEQSWSFMLGDTFVLTTALVFATVAWRALPSGQWYNSLVWLFVGAVVGVAAGTAFHVWDGGNYRRAGAEALLQSPTKIAHDFVAYPVLFGAIFCVGLPIVIYAFKTQWTAPAWGFVLCLAAWVLLVICDGLRGLDVWKLHPAWNSAEFLPA